MCVLVQGAAWQFKGWEWDQPVTLFQNGGLNMSQEGAVTTWMAWRTTAQDCIKAKVEGCVYCRMFRFLWHTLGICERFHVSTILASSKT